MHDTPDEQQTFIFCVKAFAVLFGGILCTNNCIVEFDLPMSGELYAVRMSTTRTHEQRPRRSSSLKKSNSFKIKRMGNIIVCDCCGQGHEPGKNHLYDYPDNIDDDLLCKICLQPLVDPVDTPCSHTFCYICLKSHLRMQKTCPTDRKPLREKDLKPPSILVRKILDKLTVVCPNNAYCDQTMPRSALEVHLKYHCPGSYSTCPREDVGCEYIGPRCQLEEHLWSCSYGSDVDRKTGMQLPLVEGQATTIEIPKGTSDLGLSISWCETLGGMIIEEIFPEGNAYRDGRLCTGDRIVEIDDQDFTQKTLAQATLALSATTPLLRLSVFRESLDEVETELVELVRPEGKPLGIQIRTSRSRPGIFVHYLVPGSKAEECGLVHPGDRIIEANGVDLRYSTVDEAATFMTQVTGSLKLLLAHHHRTSGLSGLSSLSSQSSSPIYDEIMAPSGFRIGEIKCVLIKKQPDESFGMNVAGGLGCQCGDLPVFVSALKPDSVTARSHKIQKGDILLTINDIPLIGKTHQEAVQTIKSITSVSTVRMELIQGDETEENAGLSPDWTKWMAKYEAQRQSPVEYTITLIRTGKVSLGFSIVGGANSARGNSPVYIRSIASKSITAEDGRLRSGDELLKVNGISVGNMSQNQVVQVIKNTIGNVTLTVIPCEH